MMALQFAGFKVEHRRVLQRSGGLRMDFRRIGFWGSREYFKGERRGDVRRRHKEAL